MMTRSTALKIFEGGAWTQSPGEVPPVDNVLLVVGDVEDRGGKMEVLSSSETGEDE